MSQHLYNDVPREGSRTAGVQLTDQEEKILKVMLDEEITCQRRRYRKQEVQALVRTRCHISDISQHFMVLIQKGYLKELSGEADGIWIDPDKKAEVQVLVGVCLRFEDYCRKG